MVTKIRDVLLAICLTAAGIPISYATDISQKDLADKIASGAPPLVLDVRSPDEYNSGHVPTAINVPHTQLEAKLAELKSNADKPVVVYCEAGPRAKLAEKILNANGFSNVLHLTGDMQAWRENKMPMN